MEVDRLDSSTFGLFDLFSADPQSKAFRGFHHAICSGILICRSAWDPASLAIVLKHLIRSRERPESGCPVVCACSNKHLLNFSRHGFLQQALHGLLHGVQFFVNPPSSPLIERASQNFFEGFLGSCLQVQHDFACDKPSWVTTCCCAASASSLV